VSSRTYLSIGDVLTLLREEFPDVTISKIRFLESQGLVNPERSPSGYRKFFDHDVERLRWVLRQQREHFLPLKVIRDRLADGDLDVDEDAPGDSVANGKSSDAPAAEASQPTKADEDAMARILADASRRAALLPDAGQAGRREEGAGVMEAGAPVVPDDRVGAHPAAESRRQRERSAAARAGAPAGSRHEERVGGKDGVSTAASAPSAPPAAAGTAGSAPAQARGAGTGTGAHGSGGHNPPDREVPRLPASMVTGASLTVEELCSASGLSPEELAGLESYGLVEATIVAGMRTYDEDALTLANLAASFRNFGIEPRHLRLYRNAADREMGLIEQVVIPLLRQRNPESRQRAADAAEQLAALGQSMRATLLRAALRRHLGG
jgi:DNA-binding transcriptional MerR regulator